MDPGLGSGSGYFEGLDPDHVFLLKIGSGESEPGSVTHKLIYMSSNTESVFIYIYIYIYIIRAQYSTGVSRTEDGGSASTGGSFRAPGLPLYIYIFMRIYVGVSLYLYIHVIHTF